MTEALRIAHVAPLAADPYQGVLAVVVHLAAALARRGHHVEVWQPHPWPDDAAFRAAVAPLDDAGVERVHLPLGSRWRLGALTAAAIAGRPVDVVHLHSVFTPINRLYAGAVRVPYVLSPHGGYALAALARHRWRKAAWLAVVDRRLVRGAALGFALTDAEAADLRRLGARSVAVVPNGIAPVPTVNSRAFRSAYGLREADRLGVFVGRLDIQHKGLDRAVAALAQVPAWRLALVGPDFRGGAEALRSTAVEGGVADRLILAGPRYGVGLHEALAAADLFVLASRWEGQPLSLLEALAHGVPALVTQPVEQAVGVARAGAGWCAGDDLAAAWKAADAADGAEWQRRREAARQLVADRDWDTVALSYEEAYRRID
jgi:glycosyltransferase involved in cell wall biosynthesis